MNITAQIKIDGVFQEDKDDILAAFIGDLCVGVASPKYIQSCNVYFTFADIYGNAVHNNKALSFKLWDASTGRTYPKVETSVGDIRFTSGAIVGSIANPVIFNALNIAEQHIDLKEGWNWISTNVINDNPAILNQMKTSLSAAGTLIKSRSAYIQQPNWLGNLNAISEKSMYLVNTNQAHKLVLEGQYANPSATPIDVASGWNWIAYVPSFSLPVNNALAGINASEGDIVKAQSGYATYVNGNGWIGSLTYMQPGKGYMYHSTANQTLTLIYPGVSVASGELRSAANTTAAKWSCDDSRYASTMTFTSIAVINGAELQGDQIEIAAFSGPECRGSALLQATALTEHPYLGFLTVYGEGNEALTFRVYNHATDKEYVIATNATFTADGMYGNPASPFVVSDVATGINAVSVSQIGIYPSPAETRLFIRHSLGVLDRVEVVDLSGRLLMIKTAFAEGSLDVSSLNAGVYVLQVTHGGQQTVYRFTKK
jgi:hypothetical protein